MQRRGGKYFDHIPLSGSWGGVKNSEFNFFQSMDMLHVELKEIANAATWNHKFCFYTYNPNIG